MDKEYFTVAEVARKLNISDRAVRQRIASDKLEAARNGRAWKIPASAVLNGSETEDNFRIVSQMQSEIDFLRSELAEKNRQIASQADQIDHLQQLLAVQTKTTAALREQLEASRQAISEMHPVKPSWKRLFRWG